MTSIVGFFGWFSLLVICKFLVMFLNSLFFLCVSLYLWYVFFWVFIYWFLWRFRVFSLSFLFIFNSGEFFHFYNFDFFLESCWAFPPCPPTQWCVEVINPNFCSNDSRQWSTLFERGQGEGWKQNLYSAESLWFFWVCVIVKICRVQRCHVERVEKKNLNLSFLHCWNCTFAPLNFLNLFSGSVWLWKFAGCKGAMLKG